MEELEKEFTNIIMNDGACTTLFDVAAEQCVEIAKTTAIEFAKYRISDEGKQQYHQCLKLIKELKLGPYEQLFDLFLKSKNKTKL